MTIPLISDYLRDSFEGSSPDMNVNGSVDPVFFDYVASLDTLVYGVTLVITCGPIRVDRFGDIPGGLLNGLLIEALDQNLDFAFDLLHGEPLRANQDISILSGKGYTEKEDAGMGHISAEWSPPRPKLLPDGFRLRVTVRDDLTGLDFFRMLISVDLG